jgi:hypothetical protein
MHNSMQPQHTSVAGGATRPTVAKTQHAYAHHATRCTVDSHQQQQQRNYIIHSHKCGSSYIHKGQAVAHQPNTSHLSTTNRHCRINATTITVQHTTTAAGLSSTCKQTSHLPMFTRTTKGTTATDCGSADDMHPQLTRHCASHQPGAIPISTNRHTSPDHMMLKPIPKVLLACRTVIHRQEQAAPQPRISQSTLDVPGRPCK